MTMNYFRHLEQKMAPYHLGTSCGPGPLQYQDYKKAVTALFEAMNGCNIVLHKAGRCHEGVLFYRTDEKVAIVAGHDGTVIFYPEGILKFQVEKEQFSIIVWYYK